MIRSGLLPAILLMVTACSREPRSVPYFADHGVEASKTAAACAEGTMRGQECANALSGIAAAKDKARLNLYRRSF